MKTPSRKTSIKKFPWTKGICLICSFLFLFQLCPFITSAVEESQNLTGRFYEFDGKSKYEIDSSSALSSPSFKPLGTLSLTGEIEEKGNNYGFTSYSIKNDTVFNLKYNYSNPYGSDEYSWHLAEDSGKEACGVTLNEKIKNGVCILQTSKDGRKWVTSAQTTDLHGNVVYDKSNGINDIQLLNGCFYRLIIAYKVERSVDKQTSIPIIGTITTTSTETSKRAEVYTFFASYPENTSVASSGQQFKWELSKYSQKMLDNKYSDATDYITPDDYMYGVDLGYFTINGYTDQANKADNSAEKTFLKTVDNTVVLKFRLTEDIDCLKNSDNLSIVEDKDGQDAKWKQEKHNLGRGELIISHEDVDGSTKYATYSNFLEALASPGADTTIQLFEEGDYHIHLNYAIKSSKLFGKTQYYQMSFSFKIRNSLSMVWLFDSENAYSELTNGDITSNGFRVDTAKSKYTKLTVKREIINNTKTGLTTDSRGERAAHDGEVFSEEGIYTITAYNQDDPYVSPNTKTIYVVRDNDILLAYIKYINSDNPYTIGQISDMKSRGYTIDSLGTLIPPKEETTVDDSPIIVPDSSTESTTEAINDLITTPESTGSPDGETNSGSLLIIVLIIVLIVAIVVAVIVFIIFTKRKKD